MNYETLYNSIQAYAENTESLFVANIPVFIQEAEDRIYNSVQIPALRRNVTGTMSSGNQYISENQISKIEEALHKMANEIGAIKLT